MRYFVVSLDGQKYGPADIPTLQQWIVEGRILPNTYLEEEIGGARLQAGGVTALRFTPEVPPVMTAPPSTGYGSVYSNPQGGYSNPQSGQDLSQNPYADGRYAYQQDVSNLSGYSTVARQKLNNAWVLGVIGLTIMTVGFCCMVGPAGGALLGVFGMLAAKKARDAGHPNGQAAYIFNIVVIVLSIILLVLSIAFFALTPSISN